MDILQSLAFMLFSFMFVSAIFWSSAIYFTVESVISKLKFIKHKVLVSSLISFLLFYIVFDLFLKLVKIVGLGGAL